MKRLLTITILLVMFIITNETDCKDITSETECKNNNPGENRRTNYLMLINKFNGIILYKKYLFYYFI